MHELIRELYSEQPTGELYHYTNSGGVLGIVQSHSIWATEVRYLDDATELSNTLERIGGLLRSAFIHLLDIESEGAAPGRLMLLSLMLGVESSGHMCER